MPYTSSSKISRTTISIDHPLHRAVDLKILNMKSDLQTSIARYEIKIKESTDETEKELYRALVLCIEKETNADIDYWLMEKRKIESMSTLYLLVSSKCNFQPEFFSSRMHTNNVSQLSLTKRN
jgi:hypothetical protein